MEQTCCINIKTDLRELRCEAEAGEVLLDVLRRAGAVPPAPCGGNGTCGRCTVRLNGSVLRACQARVSEDCTVEFSEQSGGAILTGSSAVGSPAVSAVQAETLSGRKLCAAVDLGTTTVVMELLDADSGAVLGTASGWNAQAPYGADVITRCQYCMEHGDGVKKLQALIREQTAAMLKELGASHSQVQELFVAGNTVMQHLYAGLSPAGIATAPFRPLTLFEDGRENGERIAYAPCVAGYLGGDITAGVLACGLHRRREHSLFLDIGTNGEMLLGGTDGFLGCSVASGPAFEGVGISCGMAGINGAVSHITWPDGAASPLPETIGGAPPRGICGSGLIDLLAALTEKRMISGSGLLYGPDEAPAEYRHLLEEDENGNGIFLLTEDRKVFLTAADVRKLQLAKAAVAAGIEVLLEEAGLRAEDLDRLYLAGGFGTYMNVRSAAAIGMLPACLVQKAVSLGNSSLAGARLAALSEAARRELNTIPSRIRYLELSGNRAFNRIYPEQMLFYEEDDDEWN